MAEKKDKSKESLVALITKTAGANPGTPFLKHINHFRNTDGKITHSSIRCKWAQLTQQNCLLLKLKASITMTGANCMKQIYAKQSKTTCPYLDSFKNSAEIMPLLKHSCDTGVVNKDGSINITVLTNLMSTRFEQDRDTWVIRKSSMMAYMKERASEDKKASEKDPTIILKVAWYMPAYETVAGAEWEDQFTYFSDYWVRDSHDKWEPAITAQTFLQFYFESDNLIRRKLDGELPVAMPDS